jgi:hypothetical protein
MFALIRLLCLLFAFALTASAASEEYVTRQVAAAPGEKLFVEVDFGTIDVAPGADDKVALEAHRKIDFGDEAKEKEFLANAPITLTRDGNVVAIRSRGNKTSHWNPPHQERDATYTLRIPKKFETDLRTDGGSIKVSDIVGNLKADTRGGRLRFRHLEGALNGTTSGGTIEVDDCRGAIDIETSGGHIKTADGKGTLNAHTSGGHIEVRNFSGDVDVRTNGGDLDLEKISGKLVGKTSGGAIRAAMPGGVLGDINLGTSAGNIDIIVPASAAVTIDANTSVGQVVSDLPIQASDVDREHLRGTLNGGGKSVRLETSAGNITITRASREVANR